MWPEMLPQMQNKLFFIAFNKYVILTLIWHSRVCETRVTSFSELSDLGEQCSSSACPHKWQVFPKDDGMKCKTIHSALSS